MLIFFHFFPFFQTKQIVELVASYNFSSFEGIGSYKMFQIGHLTYFLRVVSFIDIGIPMYVEVTIREMLVFKCISELPSPFYQFGLLVALASA
jgi:hypothetical protein